jgi:hypothetical protein
MDWSDLIYEVPPFSWQFLLLNNTMRVVLITACVVAFRRVRQSWFWSSLVVGLSFGVPPALYTQIHGSRAAAFDVLIKYDQWRAPAHIVEPRLASTAKTETVDIDGTFSVSWSHEDKLLAVLRREPDGVTPMWTSRAGLPFVAAAASDSECARAAFDRRSLAGEDCCTC